MNNLWVLDKTGNLTVMSILRDELMNWLIGWQDSAETPEWTLWEIVEWTRGEQ